MDAESRFDDETREAAAQWFAKLRRTSISDSEEADFASWLAAAPANVAAYDSIEAAWNRAGAVQDHPQIMARREAALSRHRRLPLRFLWPVAAIAASLVVAIMMTTSPSQPTSRVFDHTSARIYVVPTALNSSLAEYATKVGERRVVRLADGSAVTLDTDTRLRVASLDSKRLVMLERGRAFFQVAKDSHRPFVVVAGDKRVMALGTAFEVRLEPGRMSVTLREGRVRVETADSAGGVGAGGQVQAAELVPGTRLVTSTSNGWELAKVDVSRDLSWTKGQLVFDDEDLASVIAEMNRYSSTKLMIRDPALQHTRVSGVFDAGKPLAFAIALSSYNLVRIAGRDPERIYLDPP